MCRSLADILEVEVGDTKSAAPKTKGKGAVAAESKDRDGSAINPRCGAKAMFVGALISASNEAASGRSVKSRSVQVLRSLSETSSTAN